MNAKLLTERFLPGLGTEHEVGCDGLGVSVQDVTLACNTSQSIAQLIAGANNNVTTAAGPVVHSLGTPPTVVLVQQLARGAALSGESLVNYQYATADNSAAYIFAKTNTGSLVGVATRVISIR